MKVLHQIDEKRSLVVTVMMSLLKMFQLHNSIRRNHYQSELKIRIGRFTSIRIRIVCLLCMNSNYCAVVIPDRLLLFEGCLKNCFDLIVKMPRGRRTSPSLSLVLCVFSKPFTTGVCIQDYNALTCTYRQT